MPDASYDLILQLKLKYPYDIVFGKLKINRDVTGSHTIHIKCPYCPRRHIHGWPMGSGYAPQCRDPHCDYDGREAKPYPYWLAPAPGELERLKSRA